MVEIYLFSQLKLSEFTMKLFISALFVVLGASSNVRADSQQNETSVLDKFIYKRCQVHSSQSVTYDNLKSTLDDFTSYLKYTSNLLPNGKQQFCIDEKPKLINSMRLLKDQMGACFPRDEKYLPNFLYKSFIGFLNFLCANNARNINNLFSSQSSDCRKILSETHAKDQILGCFNKIIAPFNGIVKKDFLCDDLSTAKKCFSMTIDQHCSDFRAFRILVNEFFEAIKEPCNASPSSATRFGSEFAVFLSFALILQHLY